MRKISVLESVVASALVAWAMAVPVRAGVELVPADEAIRSAVGQRVGAGAELSITLLGTLPLDARFRDARPDPAARFGRPIRFALTGETGATSFVTALVRVSAPHVVAREGIGRGHIVGATAISLEQGELRGLPLVRILTVNEIVGTRALRPIDAGDVVLPSFVAIKRAVEPGDTVTVLALVGPVEVRATFVAADGGDVGGIIRVRNPDNRTFVRGRIVSAGVVEVIHER